MKSLSSLAALSLLTLGASAPEAKSAVPEQSSRPEAGGKLLRSGGERLAGQYIVVLQEPAVRARAEAVPTLARALEGQYAVKAERLYTHALRGFMVRTSEAQARALSEDPQVKYVVEDARAYPTAVQTGATWGLDRIDGFYPFYDGRYYFNAAGYGVHAYVIDTGIKENHVDIASRVSLDYSAVADGLGAGDCNGHGTHVAGTLGGLTWGVAKGVNLHSVRVFGCAGGADWSTIIGAVDWVTAHHIKPAVANMSLGGPSNAALDEAVRNSTAAGVVYVVAAGNDGTNACAYSPARVPEVLTVGATDSTDWRAPYSNYGECLDLFAPGSDITSAWIGGPTATQVLSGTSMASPHVAGAAVLYLDLNPTASPATVASALTGYASANKVLDAGPGSPNRMVFSSPYYDTNGMIRAQHSGQCFTAPTSNGGVAPLLQMPCADITEQRFDLDYVNIQYVRIKSRQSGLCLSVANASQAAGAPLTLEPCGWGTHQHFHISTWNERGYSVIQAEHSQQCLDMPASTTAQGAQVTQWPCHGDINQRFRMY